MKKFIALCMAGTMLASTLPVMAQYETAVELKTNPIQGFGWSKTISGTRLTDATEATFTVGGKTFALLDTDAVGNSLIISSDYYGRPWWSKTIFDTTISEVTGTGTDDDPYELYIMPADTIKNNMDAVKLTPNVEGTLGYWLNNDYYNDEAKLPAAIKDKIVTHDWQSEAINPNLNPDWGTEWKIKDIFSDYDTNTLAKRRGEAATGAYTVSAKVMIPSYSEYLAYKDKIGVRNTSWQGMMIRTVNASGTGNTKLKNTFIMGPSYMIGYTDGTTKVMWDIGASPTSNYYYARPMFWVNPDFFKDVKVSDPGADVVGAIKKFSVGELLGTYTTAELEAIGCEVPEDIKGYLNYPSHEEFSAVQGSISGAAVGASPAENVFYVDDGNGNKKGFVLLDRDIEGNYFVIAENEYGRHWFANQKGEDINKLTVADSEWNFNPANTNSIASWLNDESETGFVASKRFPKSVWDNIIPFDWQVENKAVSGSISAEDVTLDDYTNYQLWLKNNSTLRSASTAADPRFKLSLMSYTEYKTYKDKIGAVASRVNSPWAGFMTRTTSAAIKVKDGAPIVTNNFYHICGSNNQTKVSIDSDGNLAEWCQNAYAVRPVFWLDKDFFKNVKVEISKEDGTSAVGSNVLTQMKKHSAQDLKTIYSLAELKKLGIDCDVTVTDIALKGADGQDLTSINGAAEINAEFTFDVKTAEPVVLIVAVYNGDNKMEKCVTMPFTPTKELNSTSVKLDGVTCGENYKCKAMVWDSLQGMTPYAMKGI